MPNETQTRRRISVIGRFAAALALSTQPTAAAAFSSSDLNEVFDTGSVVGAVCSGVFIARRTLDDVLSFELTGGELPSFDPRARKQMIKINHEKKTVSMAVAAGLPPLQAAYRDGLGCSLLPYGASLDTAKDLPKLSKQRPKYQPSDLTWPSQTAIHIPRKAPKYQRALDAAMDKAFSGETYGKGTRTIGVVVIHKDAVVAERYRDGFGPHTQYRTWSTAKSLASAVLGAAIEDGIVSGVDMLAPIAEWQAPDDARKSITLENLLHMASGLKTVIPHDGSDTPAAYSFGIDSAVDAARQPLQHKPGTTFHYSNYDTLLLMRSLKQMLGDNQAYLDFPYERLFDRIGMHDTFAETDAYGNYIMSSKVWTTARDLARFGYLYLNDGLWKGERILPKNWAKYSCKPTNANRANGNEVPYGAQWWIQTITLEGQESKSLKVCYTDGWRGQRVTFIPEYQLVIARTGADDVDQQTFDSGSFFQDIISSLRQGS